MGQPGENVGMVIVSHKESQDALYIPQTDKSRLKPLSRDVVETAPSRARIDGIGFVQRVEVREDNAHRKYVAMTLRLADGGVYEARWWRFSHPMEQSPREDSVYYVVGTVDLYKGDRQISISAMHLLPDADLTPYIRTTRRSGDELKSELALYIKSLAPDLAALVSAVLSGDVLDRYCVWPAAQRHHGSVRHGLLAHSLGVANLVTAMCETYSDELPCDRSIAIAAALLHDIGKIRTLPLIAGSTLPEIAGYFDHVTLGVLLIQDAAAQLAAPLAPKRLESLLHAIVAHHGRREWGATVEPQTVEAWLIHLADLAEARLWSYSTDAGSGRSSVGAVRAPELPQSV